MGAGAVYFSRCERGPMHRGGLRCQDRHWVARTRTPRQLPYDEEVAMFIRVDPSGADGPRLVEPADFKAFKIVFHFLETFDASTGVIFLKF